MPRKSRARASSAQSAEKTYEIVYAPKAPTIQEFHRSRAFVKLLMGPFGSAKSTACTMELFTIAAAQPRQQDGIRRSRMAIIRNTYPELRSTTMNTWLSWFPENRFGGVAWTPPYEQLVRVGDIEMEIYFFALDRPEDIKKLLSLELTAAWVNETREIGKEVIDALTGRVGRYPSAKDGGSVRACVLLDTNPPDESHWIGIMAGWVPVPEWMSEEDALLLVKPDNWLFLAQPPAVLETRDGQGKLTGYRVNPEAENLENVGEAYYYNQLSGKRRRWILVHLMNKLGTLEEGQVVYPGYNDERHAAGELAFLDGVPIGIGWDPGLTGCALIGQETVEGQLLVLREFHAMGRNASLWAKQLMAYLRVNCPWLADEGAIRRLVRVFCDPSGDNRAGTDGNTPVRIWRGAGFNVQPARTNDPTLRIEAVSSLLERQIESKPMVLISRRCEKLLAGFRGRYIYAQREKGGPGEVDAVPKKDSYSHVQDAMQYLALEYGGLEEVLRLKQRQRDAARPHSPAEAPGFQRKSPFDRQRVLMGRPRRASRW